MVMMLFEVIYCRNQIVRYFTGVKQAALKACQGSCDGGDLKGKPCQKPSQWCELLKHNGRGRATTTGCVQEMEKKGWSRGGELQKVIGYSSAALWAWCGCDTCGVTFPSLFQTHSTFFAEVVTFPSIALRLTYGGLFHSCFSYPAG